MVQRGLACIPRARCNMAVDDSNTKVLLHLDGTDASTTITDESGKTWTARGNAQIDTAQSKFGGASLLLDGTGDWIDTPDHADFNVGTGSVTYDLWIRFNSVAAGCILVSQYQDANNVFELSWSQAANKIFCYQYQASAYAVRFEAAWTPSTNTWYHVEVARSSSAAYIFVDGTLLTTTVTNGSVATSWNDLTGVFAVGAENGTTFVNGWIDEFRYSTVVRHTSSFTPPTVPYGLSGAGAAAWFFS